MLVFNLKKEWFEKIKSGEKTHEYREVKPYWTKRLYPYIHYLKDMLQISSEKICFCLGYPERFDEMHRVYGNLKSINIINGKHTDLAIDKDVYDIEFELIKG